MGVTNGYYDAKGLSEKGKLAAAVGRGKDVSFLFPYSVKYYNK